MIVSRQNHSIKRLLKLKTKKYRNKEQVFILDGLRIVKQALENNMVEEIYISNPDYQSLDFERIYLISDELMREVSETKNPQGIIAVCRKKENRIIAPILLLDEIQDPGNAGTLIRTAEAAGFKTVLLKKNSVDPYSQKSIRSSMGSIVNMNIFTDVDIKDIYNLKKEFTFYGGTLDGKDYNVVSYDKDMVLVIGSEANGITDEMMSLLDIKVKISMEGTIESLNASIAGAVLMFKIKEVSY